MPVLLSSGTQAVRAKRHGWPMAPTVTDKGPQLPTGPVPKSSLTVSKWVPCYHNGPQHSLRSLKIKVALSESG